MDLRAGGKVLFTGTSCQIVGLKCFLGKEYDALFCIDIVVMGYQVWLSGKRIYSGKRSSTILMFLVLIF